MPWNVPWNQTSFPGVPPISYRSGLRNLLLASRGLERGRSSMGDGALIRSPLCGRLRRNLKRVCTTYLPFYPPSHALLSPSFPSRRSCHPFNRPPGRTDRLRIAPGPGRLLRQSAREPFSLLYFFPTSQLLSVTSFLHLLLRAVLDVCQIWERLMMTKKVRS